MKMYSEKSLSEFEFWSGAKDRAEKLTSEELDQIESTLEPNGSIYVTKKDSQGRQQENNFCISAGDFTTMLNWYRYQKDQGNTVLDF